MASRTKYLTAPVRDDRLNLAMPLQRPLHEGQGCRFVAFLCKEGLQNFVLLIDPAPQVNHLAIHLDVHFIKVPM